MARSCGVLQRSGSDDSLGVLVPHPARERLRAGVVDEMIHEFRPLPVHGHHTKEKIEVKVPPSRLGGRGVALCMPVDWPDAGVLMLFALAANGVELEERLGADELDTMRADVDPDEVVAVVRRHWAALQAAHELAGSVVRPRARSVLERSSEAVAACAPLPQAKGLGMLQGLPTPEQLAAELLAGLPEPAEAAAGIFRRARNQADEIFSLPGHRRQEELATMLERNSQILGGVVAEANQRRVAAAEGKAAGEQEVLQAKARLWALQEKRRALAAEQEDLSARCDFCYEMLKTEAFVKQLKQELDSQTDLCKSMEMSMRQGNSPGEIPQELLDCFAKRHKLRLILKKVGH